MMRCAQTLKGHKSSVRCVQFDDTRIVSGSWDNTIKVRQRDWHFPLYSVCMCVWLVLRLVIVVNDSFGT
jgi:WD40 repeat protein